ncbi:ankyrin repeat-containing domain protein [Neurospora tetraspora]|uniref:Ankyrin repeat-containing domain protein n=1 Tax=Neurospora tetraspora TaxID=94610 RepID=A0AAE0J0V9_9PEZI|nr:ankyrin repeat-containing domain protein [Neurospora tetraspora]
MKILANTCCLTSLPQRSTRCDIKVVELLLEAGASPNVEGKVFDWNTPVHIALENGRADIFRLLLQHGGDPNLFDRLGQNVLHMAIRKQSTDMVSLLLDPWIQNIRYEEDSNRSTSPRRRSSWNRHGAPIQPATCLLQRISNDLS